MLLFCYPLPVICCCIVEEISCTHAHDILCDTLSFFLDTPVLEYKSKMFVRNIAIGEFCYKA